MKVIIYWVTKDRRIISRIRDRFKFTPYISVNGETSCEICDKDIELLRETEKRGFIQIRKKIKLR